mgnify:CR=1 FL=1
MNTQTIDKINRIIAQSGCGEWEIDHETTLYLSHNDKVRKGYDCITYYRGGDGYPERCFVKERLYGGNSGVCTERVDYATAEEFLKELMTQTYWGGMWRDAEQMKRINNN